MGDWISVEDRLPEELDEVVAYFPALTDSSGKVTHYERRSVERLPVCFPREPTHWMPLPESPNPDS